MFEGKGGFKLKTKKWFFLILISFLLVLILTPVSAETDGARAITGDEATTEEVVEEELKEPTTNPVDEIEVQATNSVEESEPAPAQEPEEAEPVPAQEPVEKTKPETKQEPTEEAEQVPAEEQAEDKAVPKEEPVVEEVDQTPLVEDENNPQPGMLNEQPAPEPAMAIMSVIDVQNYFVALGTSTNNHYSVVGVYIDLNGDVHLIIDNDKNTANQTRFHSPMLNGEEAEGFGLNFNGYTQYWEEIGTSMTLSFPGGETTEIEGVRLFDFNFGPMIDFLQAENTIQILNQADGFSIDGLTFTLNLGHEITKTTNLDLATINDDIIFTMVVTNTGEFRLSNIDIYDDLPPELIALGVSEDNVNWNTPVLTNEGAVILDEDLTLEVNESKTYYLKVEVGANAYGGQTLINTAYTGGGVPRQEDTASVDIYVLIDTVTIRKQVTGNFGSVRSFFDFTVVTNRERSNEATYNFGLAHDDTFVIEDLPANSTLLLSESSEDYEVTVTVGGTEVQPNTAGDYLIELTNQDATILVTNHKDVIINTGVSLDSLPFIFILAIVTLGLGMVISRKRKETYEE